MGTVLHIKASPRGTASFSNQVAEVFLKSYRETHPGDEVRTLDLFKGEVPVFDAPAAKAKYAVMDGQEPRDEAGRKWKDVIAEINRLKACDKLVISSPMWNFGLPYWLKQWVNVVVQPGLAFNVTKDGGYQGLITGKPAMLILARGGAYPAGTPYAAYDHQKPYLEMILRFIGFEDIRSILVEPTLNGGPEAAAKALAEAFVKARTMAREFHLAAAARVQ